MKRRRAFLSFHFEGEAHQAAMVQEMGVVRCNRVAAQSEWDTIRARGEDAVLRWIDLSMRNRSVVIVLIGPRTAKRKWVLYEIEKGWQLGKGILGIHVHNLVHRERERGPKGENPFDRFRYGEARFSTIVETHETPSRNAYQHIERHLAGWVEESIAIRSRYPGWQNPRHA